MRALSTEGARFVLSGAQERRMPAANINVVENASGAPKSVARIMAVIGRCSAVSSPAVYSYDTDTTVPDVLGEGPGVELGMAIVRESGQRTLIVPCATSVAGSLTAVTETPAGTGPAVTVTGTPNDSLSVVIKIVKAGPRGTAKFRVSLDDGASYGPTLLTTATYLIPKTGITAAFATGTDYVLDTVYTFDSIAPTPSPANIDAAVVALLASGVKFSMIVVAQTDPAATDTLAMATQLATSLATARTAKRYLRAIVSSDPDEVDADVVTAFGSITAERVVLASGDAYISGGSIKGSFRRPAGWAAAIKCAKNRFSSDLGNGADGPMPYVADITRDEFVETVKLREDARATVIETRPESSGFFFARGVTLADPASVYKDLNIARLIDEACRVCQPLLNQEANNDPDLKPNGTIAEAEAERIEAKLLTALENALINTDDGVKHASSVSALVDRTNVIATTEDLRVTISVQKKGQNKTVTATMGISSTAAPPLAA